MLIDTENSVSMAQSLNYEIFQTWNFYSIESKNNSNYNVTFEKSIDSKSFFHYVKSWRWLPIDAVALESFYEQNRTVNSSIDNKNSVAIITSLSILIEH